MKFSNKTDLRVKLFKIDFFMDSYRNFDDTFNDITHRFLFSKLAEIQPLKVEKLCPIFHKIISKMSKFQDKNGTFFI